MFTPIPAVDIRGGRCVRLVQGDFSRETTYGDDPVDTALHWIAEGATRLHVIDLDGARDGVRANADVIGRLIATVDVPVQIGGGIRTIAAARALLGEGADRVVVGTAAAEHPDALSQWVQALGAERLIVAVDARDGRVATHGWQQLTDVDAVTWCEQLRAVGVERVLYTDVNRDGMMSGPDLERTGAIAQVVNVIASGGVSTLLHLRLLAKLGAEAAIIGSALYAGRLKLRDALDTVAC